MLDCTDSRRLDPSHGAARRSYRFSQAIDVRHDRAGQRHLLRKARCAEIVLHVYYDQRGAASLDLIVGYSLPIRLRTRSFTDEGRT